MSCQRCNSDHIVSVSGKTSDMCSIYYQGVERVDYVPYGIGLGTDEDYIEIQYCAECGQMQGKFPITKTALKDAFPTL